MAVAKGNCIKCNFNEVKELTLVAPTAVADGVKFEVPKDAKLEDIVIIAQNTGNAAQTVVVKAPTDGGYAATDKDLTLSIASGGIAIARVESAKNFNKDNSVLITSNATTTKVALAY